MLQRRYFGPAAVGVIACLLGLFAQFTMHRHVLLMAPLDVGLGATGVFEVRPLHSGNYILGVGLTPEQVQRVFPCVESPLFPVRDLPLKFSLHMQATTSVAPLRLFPGNAKFAFRCHTRDLTKHLASTFLEAGKTYRLTVKSLTDGTSLLPTPPKLIVEMSVGDRQERGILSMLLRLIAGVIGLAAIIWAAVASTRNKGPSST